MSKSAFSPTELLDIVRSLEPTIRSLGEKLRDTHGSVGYGKKEHGYDVITTHDLRVEEELSEAIRRYDPDTPIVGEESGGSRSHEAYWLIDPIDGTIHFVRGNPFSTIMFARIEAGVPVASAIYDYSSESYYYAVKGMGAFSSGQQIHVSERSLDECVVLVEMGVRDPAVLSAYERLSRRFKLMNLICAGYEFAMVATGKAEARVMLKPFGYDYDFAPGSLIIQEAGGVVKNMAGEDYSVTDRDIIAAANSELYHEIHKLISNGNGDVV